MTFNQLQLIFRAHLQVIVIIMFVVLFGALVTAFLIPKSYTAKATLVIDVRSPDSVFGNSGLPLTSPAYMNTQAEIVVSGRVIRQAIKTLKLDEDEDLRAQWETTEQEESEYQNWLVNLVQSRIEVRAFGAGDPARPSPIFVVLHQIIEKQGVSPSGTVCARQAGQFP